MRRGNRLPRRPLRTTALVAVSAAALVLAGCSAAGPSTSAGPGAPGPAEANSAMPFEHVHGLGVDPADGGMYVATHDGLFRAGPGGLQRADTTGRDLMGFTITGPRTFLSSGHPGPGEQVANPLGVVASTDAGATWTTLALAGEVDFHALDVSSGVVYGVDATNGLLRASTDGGRNWETRAKLAGLDVAVHPTDPAIVLATVQDGVATSRDGGRSFSAPTGPQLAYLSWAPGGTLYGLAPDGGLYSSADGGTGWQRLATVPGGRPQALTAVDQNQILFATAGGLYRSTDGGRTVTALA